MVDLLTMTLMAAARAMDRHFATIALLTITMIYLSESQFELLTVLTARLDDVNQAVFGGNLTHVTMTLQHALQTVTVNTTALAEIIDMPSPSSSSYFLMSHDSSWQLLRSDPVMPASVSWPFAQYLLHGLTGAIGIASFHLNTTLVGFCGDIFWHSMTTILTLLLLSECKPLWDQRHNVAAAMRSTIVLLLLRFGLAQMFGHFLIWWPDFLLVVIGILSGIGAMEVTVPFVWNQLSAAATFLWHTASVTQFLADQHDSLSRHAWALACRAVSQVTGTARNWSNVICNTARDCSNMICNTARDCSNLIRNTFNMIYNSVARDLAAFYQFLDENVWLPLCNLADRVVRHVIQDFEQSDFAKRIGNDRRYLVRDLKLTIQGMWSLLGWGWVAIPMGWLVFGLGFAARLQDLFNQWEHVHSNLPAIDGMTYLNIARMEKQLEKDLNFTQAQLFSYIMSTILGTVICLFVVPHMAISYYLFVREVRWVNECIERNFRYVNHRFGSYDPPQDFWSDWYLPLLRGYDLMYPPPTSLFEYIMEYVYQSICGTPRRNWEKMNKKRWGGNSAWQSRHGDMQPFDFLRGWKNIPYNPQDAQYVRGGLIQGGSGAIVRIEMPCWGHKYYHLVYFAADGRHLRQDEIDHLLTVGQKLLWAVKYQAMQENRPLEQVAREWVKPGGPPYEPPEEIQVLAIV